MWSFKTGDLFKDVRLMTDQERVIFKYMRLLNRGDHMGMFDCVLLLLSSHKTLNDVSFICR